MYIPKLETIIDFTSCYPGLEQSWKYGHLWHYVDLLKVQATYCLKSLESYCEDTEDYARVSFVGIHQNIGHHGLHELGGVQFCIDKCFQSALDNVMIVAVDLLDFRALFPEVKSFKNLEGQDTKRRRSNAFQYILNNRLTGSFIYYYGPFMEKVAERILTESRGRYEASLQKTLEVSHVNARWPVLWVTLRSKRRWVDQIDGIASVLNELYMDYPDILVVFDGLPEDESLLLQVLFKMNDGIVVHNALHSELYNTVFLVSKCDMCISPFGAGGFFTSFIANLPGIYYGSVGFLKQSCFIFEGDASPAQPRENFRQSVIIHAYWEDNDADPSVRDYKLRWEEVLVASKELLSSMSDKRM